MLIQVRTKYSHSIFYEVAKIDPLSEEKLEEERRRIFADQVLQGDDDKLFIQLWRENNQMFQYSISQAGLEDK